VVPPAPNSDSKFVVLAAGEAYDAQVRGSNWNDRIISGKVSFARLASMELAVLYAGSKVQAYKIGARKIFNERMTENL
jgi:hypothetical protein